MSRFRFSFQLYLGWTMILSMAMIFSMPCSNLEGFVNVVICFVLIEVMSTSQACTWEVLLSPVVFSHSDQYVGGGQVFVPRGVEDAVSCSEDPFITEQTGSTQQLLGAPFVQHHLPEKQFGSFKPCQKCSYNMMTACVNCGYHGAEATSASSPPTMRFAWYDFNSSTSPLSCWFLSSKRGRCPHTMTKPARAPVSRHSITEHKLTSQSTHI